MKEKKILNLWLLNKKANRIYFFNTSVLSSQDSVEIFQMIPGIIAEIFNTIQGYINKQEGKIEYKYFEFTD